MVTAHKPPMRATPPPHDLRAGDDEALLPLAVIREHTKTDDVPATTDEMLKVYRRAAIEAAEKYTGLILGGQRQFTEHVDITVQGHMSYLHGGHVFPRYIRHVAKHRFAQPIGYLYGHRSTGVKQVHLEVGSKIARLPFVMTDFGINSCCDPCAAPSGTLLFQYAGGASCAEEVPASFRLGALKYIAHVIENPGDNVVVSTAAGSASSDARVTAAANPALASGAIEIWRTMLDDAI